MKTVSIIDKQPEGGTYPSDCCYCPGGISLYISSEVAEKLGITKAMPIGTTVNLQGVAIVTDASEYLDREGKDVSMGLRITDLGVTRKGSMSAAEAAKTLYPTAD
jgi:hypothetical protein